MAHQPPTPLVDSSFISPSPSPAPPLLSIRPGGGTSSRHHDSEVYGFVLWLSTFVLIVLYLLWAFVPDEILQSVGITYYPDRFWSVVLPAYFLMLLLFVPIFYFSWNLYRTASLNELSTIRDGWTRQQQEEIRQQQKAAATTAARSPRSSPLPPYEVDPKYSIEEIVDIPIEQVNRLMYQRRR